jgi:hypothetical protein
MSRDDERRNRIPTSDELEQQGALTAAAEPRMEKRGGLLRFLRVGRFRVSDDVAARKHVGSAQPRPSADHREGEATQQSPATSSPRADASIDQQLVVPIVPRKIRIDPSVKERRGLGLPSDSREPGS